MVDFLAGETAHTHSFTLGLASFVELLSAKVAGYAGYGARHYGNLLLTQ